MVIPVYRVAGTIEACLQSVADQTQAPGQVILVDDAGGDESMELAIATAERLELPYEVVTHRVNAGMGAARNSGLTRVRGEYVWFLDSDDTAEPTFLAELLQALTATEADFVICRTLRVDPSGAELGVVEEPYWRRACPGRDIARELLRGRLRAYACNKLFRTAQLGSAPFPVGHAYEDFVPIVRLALNSHRVAVVNRPLYRYRDSPGSISNRFDQHTFDLLQVRRQVEELFGEYAGGDEFADDLLVHRYAQVLLPIANMALRAEAEGGSTSLTREAVAQARRRIHPGDPARLARLGEFRLATAVATLALSARVYAGILRWR